MEEKLSRDRSSVDKPSIGQKPELKIWQDRVRKNGSRSIVSVDRLDAHDLANDAEYAIVVRQVFTDRNVIEQTKVEINSPLLLKTFREVIKSHPSVPSDFTKPFEMESPFQMLFHHWDDLEEFKETVDDAVTRMHLSLLLDFMNTQMGWDRELFNGMLRKRQITFATLWTIFKPGSMVYAAPYSQPWLLRVFKTEYDENSTIGKYVDVHCYYTDYDDEEKIGQAISTFRIIQKRKFGGETPANITDLDVYPAKFLPNLESLMDRLSERGERFLELRGVQTKAYDGLAACLKELPVDYFHPSMADWPGVWIAFTETGRVVLDRKTFYEDMYVEAVGVSPCSADNAAMSPPIGHPVFCCPHTFGYSLARKEWCKYSVDYIKDVDWNIDAFEGLVMKEDQKQLLEALVCSHKFPENPRDQQQQKGKGLVALLHGTPGSGKTLSAECAAEATKRALLSTTIGELNKYNRPASFENRLKTVLGYAMIWKCIVLLDEADVFLEARPDESSASSERSALVAVFLRHLEYFSGIVFLTTNRIRVFDAAMKSRIHLALTFQPPDQHMRCIIWEQYLKKVPDLDLDMDEAIHTLGKEKLNGREISNTINTAQTLARFKKEPLQLSHLRIVLNVIDDFGKSLDKESEKRKKAIVTAGTSGGSIVSPVRSNSILLAGDEPQN